MLNKLVRDGIFKQMREIGQKVTYRILDPKELRTRLIDKLGEEAGEYTSTQDDSGNELADLLEVIDALNALEGRSFDDLRALQLERRAKRGGFEDRVFVERLDLEDDDEWAAYYAKEPERFPEVTPPEAPQTPEQPLDPSQG